MTNVDFEAHVHDLRLGVICAIERHFAERCLDFDIGRLLAESETDLDQFLREAFFHGAQIFPIEV
jgi:hypothetical protein